MSAPHDGHLDDGQTMDCLSGTRWITTFKKLPITRPKSPTTKGITYHPPRSKLEAQPAHPFPRPLCDPRWHSAPAPPGLRPEPPAPHPPPRKPTSPPRPWRPDPQPPSVLCNNDSPPWRPGVRPHPL